MTTDNTTDRTTDHTPAHPWTITKTFSFLDRSPGGQHTVDVTFTRSPDAGEFVLPELPVGPAVPFCLPMGEGGVGEKVTTVLSTLQTQIRQVKERIAALVADDVERLAKLESLALHFMTTKMLGGPGTIQIDENGNPVSDLPGGPPGGPFDDLPDAPLE